MKQWKTYYGAMTSSCQMCYPGSERETSHGSRNTMCNLPDGQQYQYIPNTWVRIWCVNINLSTHVSSLSDSDPELPATFVPLSVALHMQCSLWYRHQDKGTRLWSAVCITDDTLYCKRSGRVINCALEQQTQSTGTRNMWHAVRMWAHCQLKC